MHSRQPVGNKNSIRFGNRCWLTESVLAGLPCFHSFLRSCEAWPQHFTPVVTSSWRTWRNSVSRSPPRRFASIARRASAGHPSGDRTTRGSTERGPRRSLGRSPALAAARRIRTSNTGRSATPVLRSRLRCITTGDIRRRDPPGKSTEFLHAAAGWSFCHP